MSPMSPMRWSERRSFDEPTVHGVLGYQQREPPGQNHAVITVCRTVGRPYWVVAGSGMVPLAASTEP